ncbi:holin [Amycolatopsis nigrescens]|uniref:holin n=1 Tax=Amycolatopsis nigrescens TaxID=381445 RepID=UPI0003682837|nr:holin [Amycolatopsis nigrescens]
MSEYFSGTFWIDAVERAIKTAVQSFAAWLGAAGTGLLGLDWGTGLSITGYAVVLSLLTSVGSTKGGDPGTASLVKVTGTHRGT